MGLKVFEEGNLFLFFINFM